MTGARVDALIGGVWTDITSDTLVRDEILITRGRADERSRVTYSRCNLTVNNVSGKYSNRNPSSPYFGQIGRNTQLRAAAGVANDTFTRTVSNGWGTSTSGHVWSTNLGVASDYAVSATFGTISLNAVNSARETYMGTASWKAPIVVGTIAPGVVATGASIQVDVTVRRQDASNMYLGIVNFATGGLVNALCAQRVAGSNSQIGASSPSLSYNSASVIGVAASVMGDTVYMTIWDTANPTVQVSTSGAAVGGSAATLTPSAPVGVRAILLTGNTNTLPVTVRIDDLAVSDIRGVGEVPSWPQRWDPSGRDVWVPLEAAGILRRLSQGAKKLKSPMFSGITRGPNLPQLVGYWSCEDGSSATSAASGIGGRAATPGGSVSFAADSTAFPGSEPLPVCTGGGFTCPLPAYTFSGAIAFRGLFSFGPSGIADQGVLMDIFGAGAVRRWALRYRTGGGLSLHAYDQADTELVTSGAVAFNVNSRNLLLTVDLTQNGANIDCIILIVEASTSGNLVYSSFAFTANALTLTPPNIMYVGNGGNLSSTVVGHFQVSTDTNFPNDAANALGGNAGELAATRMARLCTDNGVSFALVGSATNTAAMGPQKADTLLNLLTECADADGGILYEPRDRFGLAYRTRTSLYNQTGLALDYTAGHLTPPLEPIDDDQAIKNDITASRPNGSSARVTLTTGPLSTQDPPLGIGTYEDPTTVNVQTDGQLPDVAGWRLHIGTWDEARYPVVTVNLAGSAYAADASLTATAAGVELGGYFSIANPPSWLPPDAIELLAQGAQERLTPFEWVIKWNATPAGPYRVAVLDTAGNMGRLDQPGSTLTTGVTTVATSLSITIPAGNPLWTTTDTPFDIAMTGERMTVTAVAGSSSPQTFTVTRSVNGIVKAQLAAAAIGLWHPPALAR